MTPVQVDGEWWVNWPDGRGSLRLEGPFRSNSEAWRWIDRRSGQPVSKIEDSWMYLRKSNGGVE